jgi:hypothetical protein
MSTASVTRKPGRPRLRPPPDAADRIEAAAANGASVIGVANALGVGKDALRRWLDEEAALQEAFDRGRERERMALHNALYRAATEQGNMVAAMFLLKARHGYREGDQSEQGNRLNITFTMPAPLTREQWAEVVKP